ncbi:MAG TPA: rod shape-determining protein MreC [Syntrophothermus lipocalidus]|uniref:Cell shape-determining protein MreC n=1 Tax=Syntrophothermus lipocalidus (strain DSM 12680 / TGB-C1) TaxID=643648 RepID=D7CL87_SYNLT|nr:rod shape-determining protein MreC [Syntrophothermus lipocalidus]ADI01472.1 rod shape-determining protein MreC [Syntrophothermus lipocalidus DSM 12680]HHV76773.1 rod shape-determining protein MreC [Syntrophothermus lipocalidus]
MLRSKAFWGFLVLLVLILGLMRATIGDRQDISLAEKLLRDAYAPLQVAVYKVRDYIGGIETAFGSKEMLAKRNLELSRKLGRLKYENQVLLEYLHENQRLRDMLEFKEKTADSYDLLAARVIARSPELWYRSLSIDRGEADGINKDMVVITPDGLVGRVIATSAHTAEVMLITDRESAVGALVQETRTQGLVEGLGERNQVKMIDIPYDAPLEEGQTVVTSGLGQVFPKGIRVGKVLKVAKESNGLLKYAIVKPAANLNSLEEVFVITKTKANQ